MIIVVEGMVPSRYPCAGLAGIDRNSMNVSGPSSKASSNTFIGIGSLESVVSNTNSMGVGGTW